MIVAVSILFVVCVGMFLYIRRKISILTQRISETQSVVLNHNKILIQVTASVKEIQEVMITSAVVNQTKNIDRKFPS